MSNALTCQVLMKIRLYYITAKYVYIILHVMSLVNWCSYAAGHNHISARWDFIQLSFKTELAHYLGTLHILVHL